LSKARQWFVELDHIARTTANPVAVAALWESQGVMKASEGALEQAIQALRQAVEGWARLKRRYQQALASQRLAEQILIRAARRTLGRTERQAAREEADTLLDKALAIFEGLGIPSSSAEVQALRTSTHLEAQRKRRSTLDAHLSQAGLTQRELQVLSNLAAGRTNREIATALNLSVRTVGVHVSHILTKLNCTTRTQAVSYALAKGWVSSMVEET
jgi:DNA-binding CsgD family transcriptional regulator